MRNGIKTGVVLLVLGVAALALGVLKFKSREEVFRVGDFRATTTREHRLPALRHAGSGLIVVGGVLLVNHLRRSRKR